MSKQLNIDEILDRHFPHQYYTPVYPKRSSPIHDDNCRRCIHDEEIKASIKEILEQYTEIVVENVELDGDESGAIDGIWVDKQSIRNCLKLVKYE